MLLRIQDDGDKAEEFGFPDTGGSGVVLDSDDFDALTGGEYTAAAAVLSSSRGGAGRATGTDEREDPDPFCTSAEEASASLTHEFSGSLRQESAAGCQAAEARRPGRGNPGKNQAGNLRRSRGQTPSRGFCCPGGRAERPPWKASAPAPDCVPYPGR